eukprot:IDg3694t1
MLQSARAEMQRHMSKMRINRALKHAVPAAADLYYQPGDQKKIVYVQDVKVGNARPFNVAQVKRYLPPSETAHTFFQDIHRGLQYFASEKVKCDDLYLTEILDPSDSRATSSQMSEAKRAEIRGLLERGTFKVIFRKNYRMMPIFYLVVSSYLLSLMKTGKPNSKPDT